MNTRLINIIRDVSFRLGFELIPFKNQLDKEIEEVVKITRPYTMTSVLRVHGLCQAVRYIVKNNIEGDIVECGVWRGGSMMASALMLQKLNSREKMLWLYDTFEGMSEPSVHDVEAGSGVSASKSLTNQKRDNNNLYWAYASLEDVQKNMSRIDYPSAKLNFIKGKVEETIPKSIPDKISLLRLDTDWYESTKHCLKHLFPLLSNGGILILDDYGFWLGARKAVDEYFVEQNISPYIIPLDGTGRVVIKQTISNLKTGVPTSRENFQDGTARHFNIQDRN